MFVDHLPNELDHFRKSCVPFRRRLGASPTFVIHDDLSIIRAIDRESEVKIAAPVLNAA
ncbi:hypothetical protein [Methylosinus sp. 3S-1]|uniref:hypothetical protein n=1 Tax=Methylosinus sp. 3S-1 TaxID=1849840 RepID=UPI0002FBED28|nr:hypothetical protein [Methylosinus sp. 3S-1]